jgi:hypothetical protein
LSFSLFYLLDGLFSVSGAELRRNGANRDEEREQAEEGDQLEFVHGRSPLRQAKVK